MAHPGFGGMEKLTVVSKSHADAPENSANEEKEPMVLSTAGGGLENRSNDESSPCDLHGPVCSKQLRYLKF